MIRTQASTWRLNKTTAIIEKERSMAQQISRPMLDRLFDTAQGSGRSQGSGMNVTRRLLLVAGCLCTACFMPTPSFAAAPMVKKQAPAFHRLMLGDFEVTVLSDGSNMLPA